MRNKITDDIFRDAAQEMFTEDATYKVAFDVNMAASTLLGYATGNVAGKAIGKATAQNKILQDSLKNSKIPSLEGDYYSQVENIATKLKVMFTPLSVVYMLDNKGKNVTIDVVEISEMDERMKKAYKEKDAEFFKNLMVNKMNLDAQNVELIFTKKMLDANKELKSMIDKTASENGDIFSEMREMYTIQRVVEKNPEGLMTRYFTKVAEETEDMKLSLELERPIKNYSELGEAPMDIFKIAKATQDERVQEKLLNPKYLKNKVKIGFLADRVTFMVDDIIISQLHTMAMNEEGYENFRKKDTKYFKDLFIKESDNSDLIKTASEVLNVKDIFYNSLVHPKIYYVVLNNRFGKEWLEYDPEALIKIIETEFGLTEAIYDRALDKILCIQNICTTTDCLTNDFIFEKAARALNNKPISFKEWEFNLSPGELVNALQIIDELTPANDIFDDLSEKVVAYISKAFVLGDCRAIIPHNNIISSDLEQRFFEILNSDINQRWSSLNHQEIVYQRYIQPLASAVVKGVRAKGDYKSDTIEALLNTLAKKASITDERVVNLSKQTAIANLAIDIMLENIDKEYKDMRTLLNI